ncbi:MAG: nucleotidyl transferase AbiEii/AbiGii toxin family protein [Bacteroidetes bacterium]|nr:nucleotidyl transferase AbiEii/AbiGii toxin family protein [Bacteroidota bacterium]NCQ12179.1 nucleotidyl transferase AbiEii/AbiGii toxin family protein [Bacteroidota bacterium]
MNSFIQLSDDERRSVFIETGIQMGIPPFYVEKDFWVCWVLLNLFNSDKLSDKLVFRGGTSLSKAWNCIERFSEDIDLSLIPDKSFFSDNPIDSEISGMERERRFQRLRKASRSILHEQLIPLLNQTISNSGIEVKLNEQIDLDRDPFVIELIYPSLGFDIPGSYHHNAVKLEISSRAVSLPMEEKIIRPFISDVLLKSFINSIIRIPTVHPIRTFWGKAWILYEHHNRKGQHLPALNQSRHIYDLHQLWRNLELKKLNQFTATNLVSYSREFRLIKPYN